MLFRRHAENEAKPYRFADMHCHILPGMDDGSRDEKMSLEMLRIAASEGITDMILTPHFIPGRAEPPKEVICEETSKWNDICREKGIPIRLYPGAEVYYTDAAVPVLERHLAETLNGTNRILIEFPVTSDYLVILDAVKTVLGLGYVPVLAHIERYENLLGKKQDVYRLKDVGAELQVNAATFTGHFGIRMKPFLRELLKEHLLDYIGTDAHNVEHRPPVVQKCLSELFTRFSKDKDYMEEITFRNAKALMEA